MKKRISILLILLFAVTLLLEVFFFNFSSVFEKKDTFEMKLSKQSNQISIETTEELYELEKSEQNKIIVERDNAKILAQHFGTEYIESKDPSLVEKDDTMYRKLLKTKIHVDMNHEYFIKKFSLMGDFVSRSGYELILYQKGERVHGELRSTIDPRIDAGIINVNAKADAFDIVMLTNYEESFSLPEDLVAQAHNDFSFNALRFFFFYFTFVIFGCILLSKESIGAKPEWWFAAICFLLGSAMIWGIGTNQVGFDEHIHEKQAYELSFVGTVETTETAMQMIGMRLPWFTNLEERKLVEAYEQENHDYSWADLSHKSILVRAENRIYAGMALGFKLGRLFKLDFATTLALAKYGNLILYIIIMFFAIRLAKSYQMLMTTIALLPNSIFIASQINYDVVVNAFLLLGAVILTNELLNPNEKLKPLNLFVMLSCFMMGSISKPIYIVIALMIVFLRKSKFHNRTQEIFLKLSILAIVGLMLYNIVKPIPFSGGERIVTDSLLYAGDKRTPGTSFMGQIQFILSSPLEYTKILLTSMGTMFYDYLIGRARFIGFAYLGAVSGIWTWLMILIGLFTTIFCVEQEKKQTIGKYYSFWNLLMIFGTSALIFTSLYISFNPVGDTSIEGVQGRYFIPLFLSFFSCFFGFRKKLSISLQLRNKIVFLLLCALNIGMIFVFVYPNNL